MATAQAPSTLFEELATLFASAPTPKAILDFRPSQAAVDRASQLLELNRSGELDDATRAELDQYEQAELLMRLVKARVRANQNKDMPPR